MYRVVWIVVTCFTGGTSRFRILNDFDFFFFIKA